MRWQTSVEGHSSASPTCLEFIENPGCQVDCCLCFVLTACVSTAAGFQAVEYGSQVEGLRWIGPSDGLDDVLQLVPDDGDRFVGRQVRFQQHAEHG